jgi:MATE family multidrug resistance protein
MTSTPLPVRTSRLPRPSAAEARAMIVLGVPLSAAFLVQMAMHVTDVVLMGWLGPADLAAGTLASNFVFLMVYFGMGLGAAVSPIIAQALGGRRLGEVRPAVQAAVLTVVAVSLPFCLLTWWGEPILRALGQDPAVAARATEFLHTAVWGLPAYLVVIVLRNVAAAHSRPRPALVVVTIACLFNAVAAYGLMFGAWGLPRLELAGAGLATSLASWLMALALAGFLLLDRRFRRYRFLARLDRLERRHFAELLRVGLPIGLMVTAEMGLFSVTAFIAGMVSTETLAALAIAMQTSGLGFIVPFGLAQAATVRVGLAAGRGDAAGVRTATATAFVLSLAWIVTASATIGFGAPLIVDGYLDLDDPANAPLVPIALGLLLITAVFQMFDTTQAIASGVLRGLKDTRVPMLIAIVGYWGVGLPMALLLAFPLGLGGEGIWWGATCGLAAAAALLVARVARKLGAERA